MWVVIEMTWAYDDIHHVGVVGLFPSKDEAMIAMDGLMNARPSGTSYMVRQVVSPAFDSTKA